MWVVATLLDKCRNETFPTSQKVVLSDAVLDRWLDAQVASVIPASPCPACIPRTVAHPYSEAAILNYEQVTFLGLSFPFC